MTVALNGAASSSSKWAGTGFTDKQKMSWPLALPAHLLF
jgi:hypothetical protein